MNYSFAMGVDDSIYELEDFGFIIEKSNANFKVSFDQGDSKIWEDYITKKLLVNYWNEYLTKDGVVFIFHLPEGYRKYIV